MYTRLDRAYDIRSFAESSKVCQHVTSLNTLILGLSRCELTVIWWVYVLYRAVFPEETRLSVYMRAGKCLSAYADRILQTVTRGSLPL